MSDYKVTKTVGKFMSWTGRYMFLFFVAALILTAVTISNADPHISEYRGNGDIQTYTFALNEPSQVQFFVGFDTSLKNSTFVVNLDESGANDTETYLEFISVSVDDAFSQNLELPAGSYIIQVETNDGVSYWMGYAKLNIGLILTTAMLWVVFSILISIFFAVLPFWLMIAVIELIAASGSGKADRGPVQQARVSEPIESSQSAQPTQSAPAAAHPQSNRDLRRARRSQRPKFAENTPLEKLTRKDWGWLIFGGLLFISYISSPLDGGPTMFFALLIFGGVFYNYTEREKTKDRLGLLLKAYPKATIAFVAEQLDKSEDHIIEVLRIMILDEAAPIRLDLVNRTITMVGEFGEPLASQPSFRQAPGPVVQTSAEPSTEASVATPKHVTGPVEPTSNDDSEVVEGAQGSVRQPWAYCQACGEGLKKKVKYCYVCGARQY